MLNKDEAKKYRNEWKYCCSDYYVMQLRNRILDSLLTPDIHSDKNGVYQVRSLYFDDIRNSCAVDVDAGSSKRLKYRLRYYNNDLETLHLELKEKVYGRGRKYSCPISIEQYEKIMSGDIWNLFWQTEDKLLQRFCIDSANRGFSPRIITDYEREAYVEKDLNIRVNFDRNIFASDDIEQFLTGKYSKVVLQKSNMQILEVKFTDLLPKHIHDIINMKCLAQKSFSKYYIGFQILKGR